MCHALLIRRRILAKRSISGFGRKEGRKRLSTYAYCQSETKFVFFAPRPRAPHCLICIDVRVILGKKESDGAGAVLTTDIKVAFTTARLSVARQEACALYARSSQSANDPLLSFRPVRLYRSFRSINQSRFHLSANTGSAIRYLGSVMVADRTSSVALAPSKSDSRSCTSSCVTMSNNIFTDTSAILTASRRPGSRPASHA